MPESIQGPARGDPPGIILLSHLKNGPPERPYGRFFLPGPTEVRAENLAALARPQVGHRSEEFKALYASVVPKLRRLLETVESEAPAPSPPVGAPMAQEQDE